MDYEANVRRLVDLRNAAMQRGDADAWRDYDSLIRSNLAAMNAECKLGLRDDPMITHSV